ncbi:F-box At1g61340-like [Olea europaea subsp. europaea]|uniref:F-box At1g61340-like n=1 Tax=Olea europaea subsp. europaea TaxID=158383 RepID=A0A8S0RSW6_OLEEU|nr:F-box At1g61340-like [Olea europaea subsp. europaea]
MASGGLSGKRASEGLGMGLVRNTSFGRKRVSLSNTAMEFDEFIPSTPLKRQCYEDSFFCSEKSALEAFPQDVLIRILCSVEHDDLKRLFFVSKTIREATLIAKHMHFAYSTPKKTVGFRNVDASSEFDEIIAPNAPRQSRIPHSRLDEKKLDDLSVALFASDNEDSWRRRDLLTEMEI